ncbi:IclR family transcriptional regulator [Hydrogenophaga sp. BPS33]|uniref:IclR family transcriptional regulator n=1 Tax=Hydrogenophaga sp. BPS33 TaxID=2651974 RepID=UPI00131FB777|nr:IclR family transcriptional regulator [Hydrogenophaga sp. BPS33]QHE83482.1 IclR family transcriptional regulator [Hydrogenophaga sp. BPS33]
MNLEEHIFRARPSAVNADRSGTQSLTKAIRLLRAIAARPQFGWRLSDLSVACGMDKGTVHRMLSCMVEERLVRQRASDRHYLPGPFMFELGLALPDAMQFQRAAEASVNAFAKRMGGLALLLYRSGNEYVCSQRAGSLQLAGMMVYPGTRRPLFSAAGGVAILQTLPEEEVRRVQAENLAVEIGRNGTVRLAALQKMYDRSAEHGWGVNLGDVVPGVHAFGIKIINEAGEAFASLSLVGTADLYPAERLEQVHQELQLAADALSADARKFNM